MNANDQFFARDAHVDDAAVQPLPNSRKIHVEGSRPDLRVPMREIAQADTPASFGAENNPPIVVYDTSGLYTDPAAQIDIRSGLPPLRVPLDRRARRQRGAGRAHFRYGRARLADAELAGMRFDLQRKPRRAKAGAECHADALRAAWHRHAGDGIHRDPREPQARRDAAHAAGAGDSPARRAELRRGDSRIHHAGIRPRRSRARPRDHPGEHQSSGSRADDHRPQFPGEDQCQHRQLGGQLVDPGGGREDDLGDALGRRHGDGPVDRQEHPRDARMDHPQFAGADRHGADLPGAGKSRRQGRGADLGDVPRHADRAGRAGRRLLHDPRRRAAALHPADGEAHDRHRLARRLDHGEVVPRASPGIVPLHAIRGNLRDHEGVRRLVQPGRRAAAGLGLRCQRRGADGRARDPGRTDAGRLEARRADDDRGPGPRADAPDQVQHGRAAAALRRGAVLHAGPADHRHRAGLRPHHQRRSARR